jgi:thiamine-phosphate pyrophosphorylase
MKLPPALVALSPGSLTADALEGFEVHMGALFEAGLPGFVLREARLADRVYAALFARLRAAAGAGPWLAVHDRAHLAEALGADGLQLSFRSLAPGLLRGRLADGIALGVSLHAGDGPNAVREADYAVLGPVFATPSKQGLAAPLGTAGLARLVRAIDKPAYAIGGLGPSDAASCLAAGAQGLFVLRGIAGAPDPVRALTDYLGALRGG